MGTKYNVQESDFQLGMGPSKRHNLKSLEFQISCFS